MEYLIRYTNAPYLIDSDPKSKTFGLFLRDNAGEPLIIDRITKKAIAWNTKGAKPDLAGSYRRGGVSHLSVFQMIAERYLSEDYSPEVVSKKVGISADRIKNIASELARVAFEEEIVIEQEWTDFRGEKHDKMVGRPVSFHSMRGVSAHSNGFQTCRSLHLLQIILGSVEVPGGFRFKPPYPKHSTSHPKPHCKVTAGKPLDGPHLGYIQGPEDLCITNEGKPIRIDKAYSWENPMSAHGLMHMVISNAYSGDPYPIDVMFMYMANMSWNSSMNTSGVMEMLTAKDENNEYKIPKLIYSDAYSSEMVAYADLILPDTTYMERHDCISLLDRPICEAEAAADSIRWPVIEPDRDVRGFQSVLLDLGARLKLPGFITKNGEPKFKDYADYIVNHERRPGVGPLAGFRGKNGDKEGRGESNPKQIQAYIENGGFWKKHIPEAAQFFKPWNVEYQEWAVEIGLFDKQSPYLFDLYIEPMQKFILSAKGIGEMQPPDHLRKQIIDTMDPLPIWYQPFEEQVTDGEEFPVHALTQRPMAMYHSWGSQNAWLRQIHGYNPMYLPKKIWKEKNFQEGDWALVTSRSGSIKVPVSRMDALNENTIWTWNAIGKRRGAWGLSENATESNKGFLLNHIIHELLPPKKDGMRWSNSDPITGQAAWFDLKVKVEKISKEEHVTPFAQPQKSPVKSHVNDVKYGEDFID